MKAHFRTADGRITFEVEGEGQKGLFQQIATLQEVFEAEQACGCCNSKRIRFQHRKSGKFDFFEMTCNECRARFEFGQAQEGGTLFPKRTKDGKPLPNGGWSKYVPNGNERAA